MKTLLSRIATRDLKIILVLTCNDPIAGISYRESVKESEENHRVNIT